MMRSTATSRCLTWLTGFVFAGLISGCTTGSQAISQATSSAVPDKAKLQPIAQQQAAPNAELTPSVLYDILVGEIAGQQGQLDTAVIALYRAARSTRDPRIAARATRAAIYAKKVDLAEGAAKLWIELAPADIEARQHYAKVLLDQEKPVEAELQFEKALQIAKQQEKLGTVFLQVAGVMTRQINRKTAFEVMEALVNRYPDSPEAQLALAHLGVRADDKDKALTAIDKALELKPGWQDAALYKARILIGKGVEQAEVFYKDFVKHYPRASKVRLNYARFLVDRKQWDQARKQFKRILKDSPNDADAMLAVGLLSIQAGHHDDAETYLTRHLELRPDSDQTRLYLGESAEDSKQYSKARDWYQQITSDKYYFDAQLRLAVVMAHMGKLDDARKLLHAQQPDSDRERVQLILIEDQVLREAKMYAESMEILNHALKGLPEHPELLYTRALVAEKLDDLELMEEDLTAILKKDPKHVHALNALGYSLADRTDRLLEAEELVARALELRPDDAFILDSMGWVQYRLGNYEKALTLLRRALSLSNDAEISAHIGEVLWMQGHHSKARSIWRRALQKTPDNETLEAVIKKFDQ